jgi:hypothetical protein
MTISLTDPFMKDALQFAINDLRLHYERYDQIYESN